MPEKHPSLDKSSSLSRSSTQSTLNEDLPTAGDLVSPEKRLYIVSAGRPMLNFPSPSRKLEISVFADEHFANKVYSSQRPKRSSGSCILSKRNKDGSWVDVATTTYRYGPGRDPKIALLDSTSTLDEKTSAEVQKELTSQSGATLESSGEEITVSSVSLLTRAQTFSYRGHKFTWRYTKLPPDENGKRPSGSLIELQMEPETGKSSSAAQSIVVAQFIRTEETRTPGTSRSTAGNGGLLVMTGRVGADIEERLVVSSAICMLKKEGDRRRGMQFSMLGAAASGGP